MSSKLYDRYNDQAAMDAEFVRRFGSGAPLRS